MFEAIVSVCLLSAPAMCRDLLLPGFEAESLQACEAAISVDDTDWSARFADTSVAGNAVCKVVGKIADFEEIGAGVFAHRGIISDAAADNYGDVANIGFVIGDQSIAVIDSGGSRMVAEEVYRAIRQHSDLPISHVILTHMHPDHVLGAGLFADAGAQIVGHAGLARALGDRADAYLGNFGRLIGPQQFIGSEIAVPDLVVETRMDIDLGGRVLNLQVWPQSHTGTDLTVYDAATKTLFAGDLIFDEHAPALDGSVVGWQAVIGDLVTIPAAQVMPGHGGPVLDWPEGAEALSDYLEVLANDTRQAIKNGESLGDAVRVIAQSEAANWQLFELFNSRNATVAYTELEWE